MSKSIVQTHITKLRNVKDYLELGIKMNPQATQIIFGSENNEKVSKALYHIRIALNILEEIE